ncbi:MAG: YicC/YloC family endoribonuclease [Alphaproteobacteria bacterium]
MPLASMTGFARTEGHHGDFGWSWEIRSVNGRGLDLRSRLAPGADALEPRIRPAVAARFARGSINVTLAVADTAAAAPRLRLNREVLDQILPILDELRDRIDAAPPSLDGLLRLRGVLEPVEETETAEARSAREDAMTASLDEALDALAATRAEEGARLTVLLVGHLDRIQDLAGQARACAAARPDAIRARFVERLSGLIEDVPALSEERLAQEVALLAAKADIAEEIDRLDAHIAAAGELIEKGGAVGRRLDFLCQEFNREANTLCSKSSDIALTQIGLDIKATVEQFREQVQNVE